jgi:tetratricopeptide (TPR) repeat protein
MNHDPGPISPHFIRVLTASLAYWQRLTVELDDAGIIQIDPDRRNIYRAIDMGLSLAQTCSLAAAVALQTFFLAERRAYWQAWGGLFERALNLGEALELKQQGDLLNRLGELYRHAQRLEEAVAVHKRAEALAQEQDDVLALAEARYRLGWDYLQMRQYGAAAACCHFAIDTFTRLGVREDLLTNSYWALGSLARRQGQLDVAQERLRQARQMAQTTQQPTHQARLVEELGMILEAKGLYDEALVYYDEAADILAGTASEQDRVRMQMNRAVVFYRREQWREAELAWRQAANAVYLRQSGDIQLQARLAHNLGSVLKKMGEWVEAEDQIKYALQLRLELPDKVSVAATMGGLGQVRAKQGQRDEARAVFEEARQILQEYLDDAYARSTLKIIEDELQTLRDR